MNAMCLLWSKNLASQSRKLQRCPAKISKVLSIDTEACVTPLHPANLGGETVVGSKLKTFSDSLTPALFFSMAVVSSMEKPLVQHQP